MDLIATHWTGSIIRPGVTGIGCHVGISIGESHVSGGDDAFKLICWVCLPEFEQCSAVESASLVL